MRRGEDFLNAHAFDALPKVLAVDAVAVAEEIGGCGGIRSGVDELLGRPVRGGVLGDVEVEDATAMVGEHHQDEEDAQLRGRHGKEIDSDEVSNMVGEERAPGLRRG